jgi:hypothetical protein
MEYKTSVRSINSPKLTIHSNCPSCNYCWKLENNKTYNQCSIKQRNQIYPNYMSLGLEYIQINNIGYYRCLNCQVIFSKYNFENNDINSITRKISLLHLESS